VRRGLNVRFWQKADMPIEFAYCLLLGVKRTSVLPPKMTPGPYSAGHKSLL